MKIAVAADHAGFPLKGMIVDDLRAAGHEVTDLGTNDPSVPCDYPDVAELVCDAVLGKKADRGVILCGSGVGVGIVANKFPGIRAGVCHDTYSAHQAVEHDDMNVLCVGARVVGQEVARELVRTFAGARYSNEPRHARRLAKVLAVEGRFLKR